MKSNAFVWVQGQAGMLDFRREISISAIESLWEAVGVEIRPFHFKTQAFIMTCWGHVPIHYQT